MAVEAVAAVVDGDKGEAEAADEDVEAADMVNHDSIIATCFNVVSTFD